MFRQQSLELQALWKLQQKLPLLVYFLHPQRRAVARESLGLTTAHVNDGCLALLCLLFLCVLLDALPLGGPHTRDDVTLGAVLLMIRPIYTVLPSASAAHFLLWHAKGALSPLSDPGSASLILGAAR